MHSRLRHVSSITLQLAMKGMLSALEQAEQLGVQVSLVIVDAASQTVHSSNMDRAPRPCHAIALNKALTAAGFGRATAEWTGRLEGCSEAVKTGLPLQPNMALFGGGEPFIWNGEVIGAIGVSGASEANDTLCAKAAVNSVLKLLAAE